MNLDFKHRLARRERLIGTLLTLPVPEFAEICVEAGFDWLFLDMEHGTLDVQDVQRIAQAVANRCACIVRMPANEEAWIKKVLDTGVDGIIIPHVNTVEQAQSAVRFSRYPPQGERSVALARAQRFGPGFQEYLATANERVALIVQAEHIDAVQNIGDIVNVPGIDAVLVGPFDLSASMNKPGQISDPQVQAAITRVKQACAHKHMPLAIFARDVMTGKRAFQDGFDFVAVGSEASHYFATMSQVVKALRE